MPSRCCISASRQRLQERVRNEWTDAAGECQRLGRTVKWPSGCDGRTVEGFYVACLHERGYVPIKPRNAGDGRHGEHNNIGSGWTEPCWNEGATKEWNGTKWAYGALRKGLSFTVNIKRTFTAFRMTGKPSPGAKLVSSEHGHMERERSEWMKLGEGRRSCPNEGWVNCKEHDSLRSTRRASRFYNLIYQL